MIQLRPSRAKARAKTRARSRARFLLRSNMELTSLD